MTAPPTITINATLTREGLLELREAIDALLADAVTESTNPWTTKVVQSKADRKVAEVWSRVGDNAKRFLLAAADLGPAGHEFTMNEVAAAVDRDPKTVRSWHRNLGRTLRHVEAATPEPPFMESRWDGTRNVYWFSRFIHEAIVSRDRPPRPS